MFPILNVKIPFSNGSLSVVFQDWLIGNALSHNPYMHSHSRFELQYVRKGTLRFVTEDEDFLCPAGSILLIPPSLRHVAISADENVKTETEAFLYEPSDAPERDPIFAALCVHAPTLLTGVPNCRERFIRIREYLYSHSLTHVEKIRGETILLLLDIVEAILPHAPTAKLSQDDNRSEQIQAFLAENCYSADCTCASLAERLHISPRQLHRLCIQYYGSPFRDLLHRMRMEIAAHRLQNGETSITAMAEQMGYSSVSSFSAAYKRFFGHAPTKKP